MTAKENAMPLALHMNLYANDAEINILEKQQEVHLVEGKNTSCMAMEKKDETPVMYRHAKEKHQGEVLQFTMNLTDIFRNDAILRQITESVLINKVI